MPETDPLARARVALDDMIWEVARLVDQRKIANCDCGNPGHRGHARDCSLVSKIEDARAALAALPEKGEVWLYAKETPYMLLLQRVFPADRLRREDRRVLVIDCPEVT